MPNPCVRSPGICKVAIRGAPFVSCHIPRQSARPNRPRAGVECSRCRASYCAQTYPPKMRSDFSACSRLCNHRGRAKSIHARRLPSFAAETPSLANPAVRGGGCDNGNPTDEASCVRRVPASCSCSECETCARCALQPSTYPFVALTRHCLHLLDGRSSSRLAR